MADDGMLINFDTSTATFAPQTKFKGGSWKDKLSARKAAQNYHKKVAKRHDPATSEIHVGAVGAVDDDDFGSDQPSKRRRTTYGGENRDQRKKPLQVVSSLFSYNPKAKAVERSQTEDDTQAEPSNAPLDPALQNFTSLGVSVPLAEHLLNKMEIKAPTAIQRVSLEKLLKEDTDAFLQAETGSGKTLAYLLPIVQKIMSASLGPSTNALHRGSGLFAIILAPTRELSKQISVVLESLLRCAHWLVSGTVIGGEKKKSEKARLRKGLNILIATPGRLVDHLDNTEVLDVSNVRWLVLDEGDRLMEMGFDKDIDKILTKLETNARAEVVVPGLPSKRLTLLCSATLKNDVQKLGERSLKDAVHIQGGPSQDESNTNGAFKKEDAFSAPAQLQQSYLVVPAKQRLVALVATLKRAFVRRGSVMKAIVFMSCSDTVDFHFEVLSMPAVAPETSPQSSPEPEPANLPPSHTIRTADTAHTLSGPDSTVAVFRLHGSLPQTQRTSTLQQFRTTKQPAVLVCTDVASRGLDLPNVDLVLEYDPAFSKDEHLHRIGRTARAGRAGRAAVFLLPGAEEAYVGVLDGLRGSAGRAPTAQAADEVLRRGFGSAGLGGGGDWEARATEWQLLVERRVLGSPRLLEMARRAFQSHVRAYATHVAAERHVFDLGEVHLGHLAKAFALRDKPGNMRVPGQRPGKAVSDKGKKERRQKAGSGKRGGDDDEGASVGGDAKAAKNKMYAKMREQAQVSEFNLG